MDAWADFAAASRELLATLGEQGTVVRGATGPVTLMLFVDDAVQDVGQYGRVIGNKRVLSMMRDDWQPARGDVITVRGRTSKVDEILSDDGIAVTVVMHG
jgi:hypothetical protein